MASERVRNLTHRELDIVRLVGRAGANPEIAAALYLGEATVKTTSRTPVPGGSRDRMLPMLRQRHVTVPIMGTGPGSGSERR